ncbi:MAG: DDE-type integrase/transposase/recombinase [Ramlibacter sp.]|nr:DDE-type integrase/transposase/recombinase [Ramlibacter sp.]
MTQRLVEIAAAAAQAGHGGKKAIYARACEELRISPATLMRGLADVTVRAERRRRSDAGEVALTRDEAILISALVMETMRKNGKRLHTIGHATQILRANGAIRAERCDPATGELTPLSDSAIARSLRGFGLHPDQLLKPAPARELRSLHPNHVWQVDASLCVLYYLVTTNPAEMGLQVMEAKRFYKNKPANLKRIEHDRVWSYEITDHNSGAIFLNYVLGAESGTNLAESFIGAMQQRGNSPMYGVPQILMMDMGSANTSGLFKNLLKRLKVQPLPHAPENARATGQVENARNIIERNFESALRLKPVGSLAELNERAGRWAAWYNASKVHSRHGKTRAEQWMTIQPEQLRIAPPPALCFELLTHAPELRTVSDYLRVDFKGQEYDVSGVPRVMVGEKLQITYSPYQANAAMVVDTDAEGNELLHLAPLVEKGADGFSVGVHSNVIGEGYRRHADTVADAHRKELELTAMGVATLAEAEARRRAKALPFGGRIDPEKPITDAVLPAFLPRRGTDLVTTTTVAQAEPLLLSHFEAAKALVAQGVAMSPELVGTIKALHPVGVPESELNALAARLAVRAGLRVVAGGAK